MDYIAQKTITVIIVIGTIYMIYRACKAFSKKDAVVKPVALVPKHKIRRRR